MLLRRFGPQRDQLLRIGRPPQLAQIIAVFRAAVLAEGDQVEIEAGLAGARFILVAGKPIGEPVVQYGPFVMNTRQEIEQAFADYREGRLVRARASMAGG